MTSRGLYQPQPGSDSAIILPVLLCPQGIIYDKRKYSEEAS